MDARQTVKTFLAMTRPRSLILQLLQSPAKFAIPDSLKQSASYIANHPAVQAYLFVFLSAAGGAEGGATEAGAAEGGGEAGAAEGGAARGAAGAAQAEEDIGAGAANTATKEASAAAEGAAGTMPSGGLRVTEQMTNTAFRRFVNDVSKNRLKSNVIKYVKLGKDNFIVNGNNRYLAAQKLGITDKLNFQQVQLPFQGFKTAEDVINAHAEYLSGIRY
jgi:hypothetical protein